MNKILNGHKYVANFLDAPVRVGMVYRMDDRQFIPAIHFNDAYPDIDLNRWTATGSPGEVKFNSAKEVSIAFGGSAAPDIGKTEVQLKFKRKHSVAGVLHDAVTEHLRYQNIIKQLKELWIENAFDKYRKDYLFVFDVVYAASGTLIFSEERNNDVVLRHVLGEEVKRLSDLGSGLFEYVSNSKRTLEIIRTVAHRPLFKAFYFRQNWQPEILG